MKSRLAPSAEQSAVIASTRAILNLVPRQTNLAYADDMWSPVGDHTLRQIAHAFGTIVREDDLGDRIQELGVPGVFGPPVLVVNTRASIPTRRLALRHGLAHLIAGELALEPGEQGIRFMSSGRDYMEFAERRADLFALADLVPDRRLTELRAAGYAGTELDRWLYCEIRRYVPSWPADRVVDRVGLRVALWH